MKNKNVVLYAIIGILTMIVTIIGATFAYFSIYIKEQENAGINSTSANPSGVVTFTTKTEYLSFDVSQNEMHEDYIGKKYYATNDPVKGFATEEDEHVFTLAEARVNGGDKSYKCYYNFDVILSSDNTMVPEKRGEIVLDFSGDSTITENESIDLLDLVEHQKMSLKGYFYPLRPVQYDEFGNVVGVKIIQMELYIKNTDREQAPYLANKNLGVTIMPVSNGEKVFECEEIFD